MASMAASLMWRGGLKWGSPAPKSTRLMPCARSLAASAATAMVAETSIRPMRPAKTWEDVETVIALLSLQISRAMTKPVLEDGCGRSQSRTAIVAASVHFLRISLAQNPPEHLAVVILRQAARFENPDATRRFIRCEMLAAPVQEVAFAGRRAVAQLDRGYGDLAFIFVGQAEGYGARNRRVSQHGLFQFANVNRVAARLDH